MFKSVSNNCRSSPFPPESVRIIDVEMQNQGQGNFNFNFNAANQERDDGIDPEFGLQMQLLLVFSLTYMIPLINNLTSLLHSAAINAQLSLSRNINRTPNINYKCYLIPELQKIINYPFYWGKIKRAQAEKLLENEPDGTFILRDNLKNNYLYTLSFKKQGRCGHSRVRQWNHFYCFELTDPTVFSSPTICGLIELYKCIQYGIQFEPLLTIPLNKKFVLPLLHLCRGTICKMIKYEDVDQLEIPLELKSFLREHHYKQ